ncbi:MAG: glycosyltransferase family 2 protein [Burkholderiaceae bacterium]
MLISVIVATYNRPDALAAVLRSLAKQDEPNFEVVVADDGSGPDTAAVIKYAQAAVAVPLTHVWQQDAGFRLAAARNRATAQARGEYLIYLDGDCLVGPRFVRAHRALSEPGWCVAGGRILLSQRFTATVLAEATPVEDWALSRTVIAAVQGKINRAFGSMWLPLGPLRKLRSRRWQRLRGCNFSAFRPDIEKVNGFDESFHGWGFEDSDFATRLIASGVRIKNGRLATNVYHLWHPENDRAHEGENWERLQSRIQSRTIHAEIGLDRYRVGEAGHHA